ncbi:hypothetical protein C1H46_013180 [Malus baccata]|uniref:Uncharacterized protein n=1 Tax=Malus baccata TaxID=106549 RepID=A0A540MSS1_MALBA|nr:hypothetical protein C1H46_013180 [Malus baccata]
MHHAEDFLQLMRKLCRLRPDPSKAALNQMNMSLMVAPCLMIKPQQFHCELN